MLVVAACSREPSSPSADAAPAQVADAAAPATEKPWPALPESPEDAAGVLRDHTRRAPRSEPALDRARLQSSLGKSAEKDELVAGWPAIAALLSARAERAMKEGRSSFVLFGTHHDAPAQLTAFRKLTGPLGYGPTHAVLEQFHATGRWSNVEAREQAGDTAALEKLGRDGDRAALDAVIASQRDHNHTAWKYDYLEELPALAATLRASGVALHSCDMPTALQARARAVGDVALLGLRELHCALALGDRLRAPAKVAMLWGASHAGADAAQRFLPVEADVVSVQLFGGRPEGEAPVSVKLSEPVLFPVPGHDRFVLLLAEGPLAARVDRARTQAEAGDASRLGKLVVTGEPEVELHVGGKTARVGDKPVEIALGAGHHGFLAQSRDALSIAGGVPMPEHGFVELHLESRAGSARFVVHRGR
ncbi:MAG: hypothetical protein DYH12_30680 [Sorangiineae bacterium PRO1]|nr:hypothetical protein [Sorangiineae bacterium PRO1]